MGNTGIGVRMKALLVAAALLAVALVLPACQGASSGDPEKYRKDHDRYMRTHEPKTGGPDL
jgi:hypothetical protein